MKSIAVDLGGSSIKIGLMEEGRVLDSRIIIVYSQGKLEDRLPEIELQISDILKCDGLRKENIGGIAFAYPGCVNAREGRIKAASGKYEDGPQIDLHDWSKAVFGWRMVIENDANAALLGEYKYGCARATENVALMILGTGVGTAAIIDGRLIRGVHDMAGWTGGHFVTAVNGRKCSCGGRGCVEAHASTWALEGLARDSPMFLESGLCTEKNIDFIALEKWVKKNDILAVKLLNDCTEYWSAGLVTLIHAYDPQLVVLSGGIMKAGDLILQPVIRNVRKWAWMPWGEVNFKVPDNPGQSVLLGLHSLVEEVLSPNLRLSIHH
jgi:glucokinase